MSWDAMTKHNELQRRRELARMSKVELIDRVRALECAAEAQAIRPNGSGE